MIAINNILVATDFGEAADSALRYGRELAGRFGATLHVLNVVEDAFPRPSPSRPTRRSSRRYSKRSKALRGVGSTSWSSTATAATRGRLRLSEQAHQPTPSPPTRASTTST